MILFIIFLFFVSLLNIRYILWYNIFTCYWDKQDLSGCNAKRECVLQTLFLLLLLLAHTAHRTLVTVHVIGVAGRFYWTLFFLLFSCNAHLLWYCKEHNFIVEYMHHLQICKMRWKKEREKRHRREFASIWQLVRSACAQLFRTIGSSFMPNKIHRVTFSPFCRQIKSNILFVLRYHLTLPVDGFSSSQHRSNRNYFVLLHSTFFESSSVLLSNARCIGSRWRQTKGHCHGSIQWFIQCLAKGTN